MLDQTGAPNRPNHANLPPSIWTDEKTARLKEMRAAGLSYGAIATELGPEFTRSAIAGKVLRLGMDKLPRAPAKPRVRRAHDGGAVQQRLRNKHLQKVKTVKLRSPSNGGAVMVESVIRAPDPDLEELNAAIPQEQRCTLLQLMDTTCHFPVGDVGAPDFFFCGATIPEGNTYCGFHAQVCYRIPPPPATRPYLPTGGSKPAVF